MSDHGAGGGHAESPVKKALGALKIAAGVSACVLGILYVIGFLFNMSAAPMQNIVTGLHVFNEWTWKLRGETNDFMVNLLQIVLPFLVGFAIYKATKSGGGDGHGGGHH